MYTKQNNNKNSTTGADAKREISASWYTHVYICTQRTYSYPVQ